MDKPVILRDVLSSDIAVFFEHQADEQASKMAAFPIRDVASHTESWDRRIADPSITARTIVWGEEVVGYVVAWESDGKHEVGYWIGRDYWGRGMATIALTRFLDLETQRPLYAYVAPGNAASQRVLAKCGFRVTGEEAEDANGRLVEFELTG